MNAADTLRERCIVVSLLQSPELELPQTLARLLDFAPEGFIEPELGKIAVAIRTAQSNGKLPDIMSIAKHLKGDSVILLSQLANESGTALPLSLADLEAETLLAAIQSRRTVEVLGNAWQEAKDHPDQSADIIHSTRETLARLDGEAPHAISPSLTFSQGLEYDTAHDPNALVGVTDEKTTRYLCRGQGAWVIAPSGVGKSVFLVQKASLFALGRPMFGITPVRPLRVLIAQAENDPGDQSEMVQGVVAALALDVAGEDFARLNDNVRVLTDGSRIGQKFCSWLAREIEQFHADMAFVDPLLSFAGIDVSRQEQCSRFLREWLNPVLRDTGAALIGAHHTGKPKSIKDTRNWTPIDYAYAGLGSSELVNWARAISVIVPHGDCYELKLLKRGERAGATHPNGEPTTSVWLRHSSGKLWWEQIDPPAESERGESAPGGRPSKVDQVLALGLGVIIDGLVEPVSKNEVARRIDEFAASRKVDISTRSCITIVERLVANGAIKKQGGLYVKV